MHARARARTYSGHTVQYLYCTPESAQHHYCTLSPALIADFFALVFGIYKNDLFGSLGIVCGAFPW